MLITQIPVLFSKLVQLRFQQHSQQASRALACHGIIGKDYQVISESGFNQLISSIAQSRIIHRNDITLICDAKARVHALIKAPYFDTRGQSHAVRYFALKNAKLSPLSSFKNHSQEAIKTAFKSSVAMLKTRPKRRLKATSDTNQTVWTTVRLTT